MMKTYKPTSPNSKVLDVLRKANKPLTAYEILSRVKKSGIDAPPTVYRALERLTKDGHAHKIESISAFILCDGEGHRHHPQIALCKACGTAEEIHEHKLDDVIKDWSKKSGFKVENEVVEVLGLCRDCN